MPRFKGILLDDEEEQKNRFGGTLVEEPYSVSRETVTTSPDETAYEKHGTAGAFLPGTMAALSSDKGLPQKALSTLVGLGGDILSFPARGVSSLATEAGYLSGGGSLEEARKEGLKDLGRTKGTAKGALGVVQDIALDPTSSPMLLGLGAAAKGAKGATTLGKALAKTALAGAASGAGSAAYQSVAGEGEIDPNRVITQAALGAGTGAVMTGLGTAAKKAGGKALEKLGKQVKGGELKITNPVAKRAYGKSLIEQKDNIINDLADFGVTKGNFSQAADDAMMKAQQRFNAADEILTKLSGDPSIEKVNPIEVALTGIDVNKAPYGKREQVLKIIDGITSDMAEDGLNTDVGIDMLVTAKRNLNTDKLFSRGPAPSIDDAIEQSIRKKMYLNLVDKIGEISPEIKKLNNEGKRLLDVNAALGGAASRTENRDLFGLTDFVLGGATIANPGAIAVSLPWVAGKKALAGGRAGNILIRGGRALQGKTDNTIDDILENMAKSIPETTPVTEAINYDVPAFQRLGRGISEQDIVPVVPRPDLSNLNAFDIQGVELDTDYLKYLAEKWKPKQGVYRGIYRDDIRKW